MLTNSAAVDVCPAFGQLAIAYPSPQEVKIYSQFTCLPFQVVTVLWAKLFCQLKIKKKKN
jgi:hypothetical protein